MDSKTEPASEAKERKMSKEQQWLAYVAKLRNEHDEEITRLKAELERERELRKEAVTTIELMIPLAERGMLKELNHTHQYIIDRAKKLIEK